MRQNERDRCSLSLDTRNSYLLSKQLQSPASHSRNLKLQILVKFDALDHSAVVDDEIGYEIPLDNNPNTLHIKMEVGDKRELTVVCSNVLDGKDRQNLKITHPPPLRMRHALNYA